MISMQVKFDHTQLDQLVKDFKKEAAALPQASLNKFVSLTPIDKGNARRNTKLRGKDVIVADYPYAERLDTGWSKQAPKGMSEPFEQWFRTYTEKRFKK